MSKRARALDPNLFLDGDGQGRLLGKTVEQKVLVPLGVAFVAGAFVLAALAGAVTTLSPCVLPVLPLVAASASGRRVARVQKMPATSTTGEPLVPWTS